MVCEDWFLSLSIMCSRVIHVVACVSTSLLFITEKYSSMWIDYILTIHQLMDTGVISTFWLPQTFMYRFLCASAFSVLLGIYLGVELLGHVVTLFNFLRNCQTVFHSSCIMLHSHQQCVRILISPHPHQYLLLSCHFDYSHPSGYKGFILYPYLLKK